MSIPWLNRILTTMTYHQVSGQMPIIAEYKAFSEARPAHELNKGKHLVHAGPEYPSSIILPFVPV